MPTYEYKCQECGVSFDRFQRFSEEPVKVCPECGGQVYRVIHPVGIVFKGKGFYTTDYARRSTLGAAGSNSANGGDSDSSGRSDSAESSSSGDSAGTAKPSVTKASTPVPAATSAKSD